MAVDHLTKAKRRLDDGNYDDAIGACRLAIDAMFKGLEANGAQAGFANYLMPAVPEDRANEYAKLLSALKEVAHEPHHISSAPQQYWRAEATFMIQTVQHLLALAGSLTAKRGE